MSLRILVIDGLRHTKLTGYGRLSRGVIQGLVACGHEVHLQTHPREWERVLPAERALLESLPRARSEAGVDVVLMIGSPPSTKPNRWSKPSLMFTMNDLGGRLPPDWLPALDGVDGVIVPGEFHRRVFARHVDRVYVAALGADSPSFYPEPEVRERLWGAFSLLYVGSYAFRKGTDLLLETFLEEFHPSEPVELVLQCSGADPRHAGRYLQAALARGRPGARVRMSGNPLSEDALRRLYTQADCFITLTRAEGWGLPVGEALLCGTPVIAPGSSGIGEYLGAEHAELIGVQQRPVAELAPAGFGGSFRAQYGLAGITYDEPDAHEARAAMRRVIADPATARAKAVRAREFLLANYTWQDCARRVEAACRDLIS
jgi:glycosyltransferase involved in cell wall biosynthesis